VTDTPPLIYVVDDDAAVARGVSRMLRSWGMQVRAFHSGEEFLNALQNSPAADCSVIDIQMPGMNGLEVQETLLRSGRNIPVIFITAHHEAEIEELAMKSGAIGFLRKPFADEALVGLIRKALPSRGKTDPDRGAHNG